MCDHEMDTDMSATVSGAYCVVANIFDMEATFALPCRMQKTYTNVSSSMYFVRKRGSRSTLPPLACLVSSDPRVFGPSCFPRSYRGANHVSFPALLQLGWVLSYVNE